MTTKPAGCYGVHLMLLILLVAGLIGCADRTGETNDPFLQEINTKNDTWDHQRQVKILSIYRSATDAKQMRYRQALFERILSENTHALARHLFIIPLNNEWLKEHPEMHPQFESAMAHLNSLAERQGIMSHFVMAEIDGSFEIGERVGVH